MPIRYNAIAIIRNITSYACNNWILCTFCLPSFLTNYIYIHIIWSAKVRSIATKNMSPVCLHYGDLLHRPSDPPARRETADAWPDRRGHPALPSVSTSDHCCPSASSACRSRSAGFSPPRFCRDTPDRTPSAPATFSCCVSREWGFSPTLRREILDAPKRAYWTRAQELLRVILLPILTRHARLFFRSHALHFARDCDRYTHIHI